VLRDLRPYVCTSKSCIDPDQDFASRKSHLDHEALCKESQLFGRPYKVPFHNGSQVIYGGNILYGNGRLSNSDAARSFACLFCGKEANTMEDCPSKHLWRHMEEIAFTVVSKPYEKWDFYSDSSANDQSQPASSTREPAMASKVR